MLWVYGHFKYFDSSSAGTVFIRKKTVPALKKLAGEQIQLRNNSTSANLVKYFSINLSVKQPLDMGLDQPLLFHT